MKSFRKKLWLWLLTALLVIGVITGCTGAEGTAKEVSIPTGTENIGTRALEEEKVSEADEKAELETEGKSLDEDGIYTTKDEVALYIHTYNRLPNNYITKKEAQKLGWDSKKGNLHEVAPGKSIGGSRFGNYEKQLPEKEGRIYYECDLNYQGGYRGAERLIYSNDGLIFYTEDHYNSFQELYGSESP